VDDHGECHPERSAQRESKDLRLQFLAPQGASASMADRAVRAARTYLFSLQPALFSPAASLCLFSLPLLLFLPQKIVISSKKSSFRPKLITVSS